MAPVISRCVNHHSLRSGLFICDNNENCFINGVNLVRTHYINIHVVLVFCKSACNDIQKKKKDPSNLDNGILDRPKQQLWDVLSGLYKILSQLVFRLGQSDTDALNQNIQQGSEPPDANLTEEVPLTVYSIKKTLMKSASRIHERYKSNHKITSEERMLKIYGSSLVLDISNKLEDDYTDKIWLPVLKSLFEINNHLIRVKEGKIVIRDFTEQKAGLYQNERNIIGFKFDVRLIYDHGDSEFNIGAAKVYLPNADNSKITDDSSKLLRERKDNTSTLTKVTSSDIDKFWIIQVSGLTAYTSTVNYVGDDLYVGVLQNRILFSSCIGELNDQTKSFEFFNGLLQLRDDTENFTQIVKASILQENKTNTTIGTTLLETHQPYCQTWYTPPRKQQKRSVFPEANKELLETGKHFVTGDGDIDTNSLVDDDSENTKEDGFGFVKINDAWYHSGLKKYFDRHSYE